MQLDLELRRGLRQRLAVAFIRLHPPAWRRRYAAEQLGLMDQYPSTSWRMVLDLARAAVRERLDPSQDAGRTGLTAFLIQLVRAYLVVAFAAAAARASVVSGALWLGLWRPSIPQSWIWLTPRIFVRESLPHGLGAAVLLTYALLYTAIVPLGLKVAGIGRRWPTASRVAWAVAAGAFQIWLMVGLRVPELDYDIAVPAAVWVMACAVFPLPGRLAPLASLHAELQS